ncbi:MAG: aminoglycoside 6'-N-acetyltransferase, partial [Yoonia sp.]|jgi:aminoglycoside 6'-N-acetyltransferase
MRNFVFRKLRPADLPLVRRWLDAPHVRAWWPAAEERVSLMLEDMDDPRINMMLVHLIDHPFAYIHDHDAKAYEQPQFSDLPNGARVIESFVGDPDFMGQGHASAYISARVRELRLRHPIVAVSPNTKDTHAISIYNQAGFMKRRLVPTRSGRLVQVMTHL